MERVMMNVADIKITRAFGGTTPKESKMERCRQYFQEHGTIDRDIVVSPSGHIQDGYVALLVLKENNVAQTEVVVKRRRTPINPRTTYVFGRHKTCPKEYCWRITGSTQQLENLQIGNKMVVNTKHGKSVATIVRIEQLEQSPIGRAVKGVVKCLDE